MISEKFEIGLPAPCRGSARGFKAGTDNLWIIIQTKIENSDGFTVKLAADLGWQTTLP